jgi:hypothetical protein
VSEPLIAKWLEDRGSLTEPEAAELGRLLEADPGLAKSVKDQLALDHLLSLRLAVDRRNFEQQVAQRIRNAGSAATFERSTIEAVKRADRRRFNWRARAPEAAAAALLLLGLLLLLPRWKPADPIVSPGAATWAGLRAEYFRNRTLAGSPVVRIDPTLDFSWASGSGPVAGWSGVYSARWTGKIVPKYSERYTLHVRNDDAVRLWIDGKLVIDDWNARLIVAESRKDISLEAGRAVDFKVEYYNGGDRGVLRLSWSSPSQQEEIVPASAFTHD